MSKQTTARLRLVNPVPEFATVSVAQSSGWLRSGGIVLAGSALVAVCAHISIPLYFTPVPLSLAPFAVLLLGLVLRPGLAAATLGAYLLEGAMGLPVFSATPIALSGLAHLLGPTGGYLLSYPLAAALTSYLVRGAGVGYESGFVRRAFSAALGSFAILFCGALWLAVVTHASAGSIAKLAILPFLPGDALKVVAAAALASGWARLKRHNV